MTASDIFTVAVKETREIYGRKKMEALVYMGAALILIPLAGALGKIPVQAPEDFTSFGFIAEAIEAVLGFFLLPVASLLSYTPVHDWAVHFLQLLGESPLLGSYSTLVSAYTSTDVVIFWLFLCIISLMTPISEFGTRTMNGEVNENTAEPILSTPVEMRDLMLGKALAVSFAPQLPVYISVVVGLALGMLPIGGHAYFGNTVYACIPVLFVLVPLCTVSDAIYTSMLRVAFQQGYAARKYLSLIAPGNLIWWVMFGSVAVGPAAAREALGLTPYLCALFAAVGLISFPILLKAYDRDTLIIRMKEQAGGIY